MAAMELTFRGEVWYWRGPAPFHFVTVPPPEAELIADLAPALTYGWGMVPADVAVGRTRRSTALWPKDGGYIVPLRADLRGAEDVEVGDEVEVRLWVG
jgi:hypothetical protein